MGGESKTSIEHGIAVYDKAVELNKTIDINFPDKGRATRFRQTLYNVRKRVRKEMADYYNMPIEQVRHDYDRFSISVEEKENSWAVRICPVAMMQFDITDPETGEAIDLTQSSFSEDVDLEEEEIKYVE